MQPKNKEVSIRLNRVQLIRNYKIKINRKTLTRTTRRTRRTTKWTRTISSPRPRSYSRTSQSPQWKTSWKTLPPITTCSMGDSTRTQRDSGVSCTRPSPRRHSTRTYWTSHHRTCSLGQRITRQGRSHPTGDRRDPQGDHPAHPAPPKSRKESKLNFLYRKLKMQAYQHWTKEVTFSNSRFRWLKVLQGIKGMQA